MVFLNNSYSPRASKQVRPIFCDHFGLPAVKHRCSIWNQSTANKSKWNGKVKNGTICSFRVLLSKLISNDHKDSKLRLESLWEDFSSRALWISVDSQGYATWTPSKESVYKESSLISSLSHFFMHILMNLFNSQKRIRALSSPPSFHAPLLVRLCPFRPSLMSCIY